MKVAIFWVCVFWILGGFGGFALYFTYFGCDYCAWVIYLLFGVLIVLCSVWGVGRFLLFRVLDLLFVFGILVLLCVLAGGVF